jgi:hypothetical protein
MVVHIDPRGVRRCAGARGYDIEVRLGFGGRHHHHPRRAPSGIYCQDCATRISFQLNLSFEKDEGMA